MFTLLNRGFRISSNRCKSDLVRWTMGEELFIRVCISIGGGEGTHIPSGQAGEGLI